MTLEPAEVRDINELGIALSAQSRLKFNWRSLTEGIAAIFSGGFATAYGIPAGPVTAFGGLVKAFTSVETKNDPGERAWQLIVLCFGWAIAELRSDTPISEEQARRLARTIVERAKLRVTEDHYVLPVDFLKVPARAKIYTVLRDEFIKIKSQFRAGVVERDEALRARFDSAFTIAVYEVWARKSDVFSSLLATLDPRISAGARFQIHWEAYRQSLRHAFHIRPIFGQETTKISLSQVYIPLRAVWTPPAKEEVDDAYTESSSDDKSANVVDLETELNAWLSHGPDDYIRIIGGGPGSGKSTSLRAFASSLAEKPEWRPLFIPLQHVDIRGDLRASIDRYFIDRTNGPFTSSPIARDAIEGGPSLVLIFDGLDELAIPGDAAKDVANLFVSKLTQLVNEIRGDGEHVLRVILSGRMPSFQAVRRYLTAPGRRSLEVVGYAPVSGQIRSGQALAKVDQRPRWWNQYSRLAGEQSELPPAFKDDRLREITNEPLLCYLLILSRFAVENWEAAADNQNRIYERLVNEVWRRGWGEGGGLTKRQGPGKSLTQSAFNRLMDTIALAAWLGGDTRSCSEEGFLEAVRITRCEQAWEQFKDDSGPDVTNLAMNFYLKASERTHRGFEFTHKSFGDYLSARALVKQSIEVADLAVKRADIAMQDFFRATSTGVVTAEVIRFVQDEFRLRAVAGESLEEAIRVKTSFVEMAGEAIRHGFPLLAVQDPTYRAIETRQRNAESALWMIMSGASDAIVKGGDRENCMLTIDWPSRYSFGELIDRLSVGFEFQSPILACFKCVSARRAYLYSKRVSGADFSFADLRQVSFTLGSVIQANFRGALLQHAIFLRASVDAANFAEAQVEGADFSDAHIGGSNLIEQSRGKFTITDASLALQGRLSGETYQTILPEHVKRMSVEQTVHSPDGVTLVQRLAAIEMVLRQGASEDEPVSE